MKSSKVNEAKSQKYIVIHESKHGVDAFLLESDKSAADLENDPEVKKALGIDFDDERDQLTFTKTTGEFKVV